MGFFDKLYGKPQIFEHLAAAKFAHDILSAVRRRWPDLTASVRPFLPNIENLDSPWGQFEFSVAVIAAQWQAVPNLLPSDQAQRIRRYIVAFLDAPELGGSGVASFEAYDGAIKKSKESGQDILGSMIPVMLHRLEIEPPNIMGFISPTLVTAMGCAIFLSFPGWWKGFLTNKQLIP